MSAIKVHKLNFSSPELRNDPWSTFGKLRDAGPIIKFKMPFMGKLWGATTYEAVSELLKDDDRFVRNPANAGRKNFVWFQWMLPRIFFSFIHNMLGADGDDHRRLRSAVDKAFARRNISGMSIRLRELAKEQLDKAQEAVQANGTVDLIQHFARPYPLTVICELLGLPMQDRPKFREWFRPLTNASSILSIFSMKKGMKNIAKYLTHQFDEVRKNPRPGLISELVHVEQDGDRLNDQELLSMVFLLLVAGHETTVHLISNAILTLFQRPAAKNELIGDLTKTASAVEEVLRYASPVQMSKPRYVASDGEFFGQELKKGEMISALLACANYDPAKFERPTEFDINRQSNYHMTFGCGPHTCLGIKLARSETEHALKCLYSRWPNLEPAFDLDTPDWAKRPGLRGLKTLVVRINQ